MILTFLMPLYPVSAATYYAVDATATQNNQYLEYGYATTASGRVSGIGTNSDGWLTVTFPPTPLYKNPDLTDKIDRISGNLSFHANKSYCSSKPGSTFTGILHNQEYPEATHRYDATASDLLYIATLDQSTTFTAYVDYSNVEYKLGSTIECDGEYDEVNVMYWGDLRVDPRLHGQRPEYRITSQTITVTYRRAPSSIRADFFPNTLNLEGIINSHIETSSNLTITTNGGTSVVINWPRVDSVEYSQGGGWVKELSETISVHDGVNTIKKRFRLTSSVPGNTTVSVPVTLTLS